MEITGKITGIKYKTFLLDDLKEVGINNFDINEVPSTFLLKDENYTFAISKWVSPKRTRSYPFERVYNTLNYSKKITVIPIVKDEGQKGDRDYIQWDTVSLMSLLDVFVIFAYYEKADKAGEKIKNQQFNNNYIISKIREIEQYHSSALHWNLHELNTNLHNLIDKVKQSYTVIENSSGVKLHNSIGLDNFKEKIGKDVSSFMEFSRGKAESAQAREYVTQQPKESLSTLSKAKITITNYLGGQYFLTVDEILIADGFVKLIESKHTKKGLLPSKGDIKDGLLKMILYSNLSQVSVFDNFIKSEPILILTSNRLKGQISSSSTDKQFQEFIELNNLTSSQKLLVELLFREAKFNQFVIKIQHSK